MNCTKSAILLFAVTAGLLSGCAMCANPFDECYAAFGGSRPRADMLAGRVGSLFAEAGQWSEADEMPAAEVVEERIPLEGEFESEVIQEDDYEDESYGDSYGGSSYEGDVYDENSYPGGNSTRNDSGFSNRSQLDEAVDNIIEETRSIE